MSGSYSSRLRAGGGGGGLGATTVLAAKVAFASAALAAAACVVPQLVSGADAFLWKLYLFVTVHVIIFVIWKLSDSKHFHAAQQHKDPWAPSPIHHPAAAAAVPPLLAEEVVLAPVRRKVEFAPAPSVVSAAPAEVFRVPTPVSRRYEVADPAVVEEVVSPGSCGGESCVTTESEEDSSSAVASAYIATADTNRGVSPGRAPARERAVLERGISLPPPPTAAATAEHFHGAENDHEDGADDDDLDATWNLIMQKTRPATAPAATTTTSPPARRSSPPPPTPAPRPRAREPSVGAAELSKRSEDFIKKIHNSFGRHQ